MRIELNGRPREVLAGSLAEALLELGHDRAAFATAVNGSFVPASARAETRLRDGDRVEVVAPMQGG